MKSKNYTYYSKDEALLRRLRDEYVNYGGRQCEIQGDRLVVFALPQKPQKKDGKRGQRRGR